MTAADTQEAEQVLTHRLERFQALVSSYPLALELAMSAVDVHAAEDLAEAGCPEDLIAKILL